MTRPKLPPHWYFITWYECPICGRTETYRERRFTPRPADPRDRHEFRQTSGCGSHFL